MTDPNTIQVLIQGGAVGIVLVCLWIIYKLVTNHDNHMLEALNRNSDAWNKNTEALTRLSDRLDK